MTGLRYKIVANIHNAFKLNSVVWFVDEFEQGYIMRAINGKTCWVLPDEIVLYDGPTPFGRKRLK
jgi:hypothetical protein